MLMKCTFVVIVALAVLTMAAVAEDKSKKNKKDPKPIPEDTIYGTIACSVPAPPPDPIKAGAQTPDSNQLCVTRGGRVVIVDETNKNPVPIDNPDVVKEYLGHRVSTS